jgi:two-component system response regulator
MLLRHSDKVILLVEDNPVDEELTIMAFDKNNITNEIIVARDGVEALDYLLCTGPHGSRDINDKPQLILLDLKLPKVDGLEVLRAIRGNEHTKRTPVVILTSSKEQQDIINAYDLGTNAYVQKPVNFAEFAVAIKQLGLFWLILNEVPDIVVKQQV